MKIERKRGRLWSDIPVWTMWIQKERWEFCFGDKPDTLRRARWMIFAHPDRFPVMTFLHSEDTHSPKESAPPKPRLKSRCIATR